MEKSGRHFVIRASAAHTVHRAQSNDTRRQPNAIYSFPMDGDRLTVYLSERGNSVIDYDPSLCNCV